VFTNRRSVITKKRGKKLPGFLGEEDINTLIDTVSDLRDKAVLETLYSTGCRPKELREMKISKVDFKSGEICVMGKNGHGEYMKERIVFLTNRALRLIKKYMKIRKPAQGNEDILFLNDAGVKLTPEELNKMVKGYVREILKKEVTHPNAAYILRHSFATALMNREVNLAYIAELLGHESYSSTQIYTHVTTKRLLEAHEKFHPRGR